MRRILGFLFFVILVVIGLFFGQLNAERVTLDLHYIAFNLPLSVIVVGSLVIGLMVGALSVFLSVVLPHKARLRRLSRQLARSTPAESTDASDG